MGKIVGKIIKYFLHILGTNLKRKRKTYIYILVWKEEFNGNRVIIGVSFNQNAHENNIDS